METTSQTVLNEYFWKRHANPKSGWSRTVTLPLLIYAIIGRRWKLLLAVIVFTIINPLLFPVPDNTDAWMTKVVLAERYWRSHETDIGLLNILNLANVPITLYAIYAAYRRNIGGATVATSLSMTLKFAFVAALVRRFEDDLSEFD
ncbi:DUF6653 family protein [Halococcus saccharolyticus]|nr:DUF6653 family protein [Halococcus saccharolyticus]